MGYVVSSCNSRVVGIELKTLEASLALKTFDFLSGRELDF